MVNAPQRTGLWIPALLVMIVVIVAIFWSINWEGTPVPVPIDAPAADGLHAPLKPPTPDATP